MKILHVVHGMDPKLGGVCQAVRTMNRGLNGLGCENEIASLDSADAPYLAEVESKVHAFGPARGPWAHSPSLALWLSENVTRFDAIIVHGLWLYYGFAVFKCLEQLRRQTSPDQSLPIVLVMPHGMLDPYFQRAKDRRLKAMRNWLYWKLIESRLINSADGLLFTCEEERNLARQTFRPYKPRREFVVGLGVEEPPALNDEIRSISFAGSENVTSDTILFLSRIHEKKGVDLLLKGVANVNNGNNAKAIRPLRLLVAGPGLETTYGKKIHALAEQMDGTSISFLNMLSGNPKWAAFYRADAFALPSHQENFGIAVVEALACGRPVLISNQVNIWREIEAAGAGLVASDTLQGTQALLNKWTSISVADRILMGQRARKLYEEKFAVSTAAQSLLQAIESAYEASQKKNSHVHAN